MFVVSGVDFNEEWKLQNILSKREKCRVKKKMFAFAVLEIQSNIKFVLFVLNFVYYGVREYPVSLRVTNTNTRIRVKGINLWRNPLSWKRKLNYN